MRKRQNWAPFFFFEEIFNFHTQVNCIAADPQWNHIKYIISRSDKKNVYLLANDIDSDNNSWMCLFAIAIGNVNPVVAWFFFLADCIPCAR